MNWKEAFDRISSGSISRKQRSDIKTLLWDAYHSGVIDDLMKDDYAIQCYELIFNRKYKGIKEPDKHNDQYKNEDKTAYSTEYDNTVNIKYNLDEFKYQYPVFDHSDLFNIDDDGNVNFTMLKTHKGKEVHEKVSMPIDRFIRIINREQPSVSSLNCDFCGKPLAGSSRNIVVSKTNLLYHADCYEFLMFIIRGK